MKRKEFLNHIREVNYRKVLTTIESCKTIEQLNVCSDWVDRLKLNTPPVGTEQIKYGLLGEIDIIYHCGYLKDKLLDIIRFKINIFSKK